MGDAATEPLTMGIEEEYLLVDPRSGDLVTDTPPGFMDKCKAALGKSVTTEFLRSQIEIGTPVCKNISEARDHLIHLRTTVAEHAERFGMRLMAASTHPFADWGRQSHTPSERYDSLARDLQGAIRRMLICGMHVHIGIDDPDTRIDLMNQVRYFMPHLLALTCSSPFWNGHNMGVMSYRLAVFDGMPRTGIPDEFESFAAYERLIGRLVEVGAIDDSTKIWWDIRPSARFPTLEMRIADVCTRLEDALAVAALYQCLLRMLLRLKRHNQRWRVYPRLLVRENRWLAQRHGTQGSLVDLGERRMVPFPELLEAIIDLVREDADALDCVAEVEHARTIIARGSSAKRQLDVFDAARDRGVSEHLALRGVVKHLLEETLADLPKYQTPQPVT